MSGIRRGEEDLHFCDGSHRWSDPSGRVPDDVWRAKVLAHLEEHRAHRSGGRGLRGEYGSGADDSPRPLSG